MKNIGVILAGGVGSRMGSVLPKQFMPLHGRPMVAYSIDAFDRHPDIDEVSIVVHPDWRQELETIIANSDWSKISSILDGGEERYLSTYAAVEYYRHFDANLILHDSARPLVEAETLEAVAGMLRKHEAVAVAIPSTDTVFRVDEGFVAGVPPRKEMYLAQTPQAFRVALLATAYDKALRDPNFSATDDCGVVLRYLPEVKIAIVQGTKTNMKVTVKSDIELLRHLRSRD